MRVALVLAVLAVLAGCTSGDGEGAASVPGEETAMDAALGETMPTEELRALHRHRDGLADLLSPLEFHFTDRSGLPAGVDPGNPFTAHLTGPSDTSYLSPEELRDPDTAAHVRAMSEVNAMVWWFGSTADGWVGLWLGPDGRPADEAPVVWLDTEGQYSIAGVTIGDYLATTVTWFDDIDFDAARSVLSDAGLTVSADEQTATAAIDALALADDPGELSQELEERYR